jgi:type IV pilus assembly protein PilM
MFHFFGGEKTPFVLDISDNSIKVATVKIKGKEVFLNWAEKEEIEKGIIEQGEIKNRKMLKEILQNLIKEKWKEKIKSKFVIVSLPEEKIFSKVLKLPKVEKRDVGNIILFEAEKIIPLPLEKIYLDYELVSPLFDNLENLEVLMVATPRTIVDSYLSLLKEIDIFPVCFEPESQAICRALIKDEISTEPVLILDIGGKMTKFIIFSGNSVRFVITLPIGSVNFTEAIVKNFNLSFQEAEKLKIEKGLGKKISLKLEEKTKTKKKRDDLFECFVPTLVDLVQQIKRYLEYYQANANPLYFTSQKQPIDKIILSGGGALLKGIEDFLIAELGYKVEKGNPLINILTDSNFEKEREELLPFSTTIGLLLRMKKEKFYD